MRISRFGETATRRSFYFGQCPLLAQSGHQLVRCTCPLSGVKRTCVIGSTPAWAAGSDCPPLRGQDFDQASERGFAVFRVLKLKAKLGGFIADKMGKRERRFLRAHVSDGAVGSANDVAATAATACDSIRNRVITPDLAAYGAGLL